MGAFQFRLICVVGYYREQDNTIKYEQLYAGPAGREIKMDKLLIK